MLIMHNQIIDHFNFQVLLVIFCVLFICEIVSEGREICILFLCFKLLEL